MKTVDHMRDLVLSAAYLGYRRTGSFNEAARLLGSPVDREEVESWLLRGVVPTDERTYDLYPNARELLHSELDVVEIGLEKFLHPADVFQGTAQRADTDEVRPA